MKITIIAEIASNWEGSLSKARKLLQESKDAGADAVKFQMWRANDLYKGHPDFKLIKKSEPVSYTHLTLPTNREV